MRKYGFLVYLMALGLLIVALNGCDNRSQLEKDADKAAQKVSNALR